MDNRSVFENLGIYGLFHPHPRHGQRPDLLSLSRPPGMLTLRLFISSHGSSTFLPTNTHHQSPITHLSFVTHYQSLINHLSPITFHLSPIHHKSVVAHHLPPTPNHLSPITFHASPITSSLVAHQLLNITHHQLPVFHHLTITHHRSLINYYPQPTTI
jgi:hypothetical protein